MNEATVLLIDDSQMIHDLVGVRLRPLGVRLISAATAAAGHATARTESVDLILLDIDLPDGNGFDVCRRLKSDPATGDIPVIFLTGANDPDARVRGFEVGGVDYVVKPFHGAELQARVRTQLNTGTLINLLRTQATTDALTGLRNRKGLLDAVDAVVAHHRGRHAALLFLDLDRFKIVNDTLGHEVGDALLVEVARLLTQSVRSEPRDPDRMPDVVGRVGGDEFVVLLPDMPSPETVVRIAQRVLEQVGQPLAIEGHEISIGASAGIRYCDHHVRNADELLRDADQAMYQAKAAGRGGYIVFDEPMRHQMNRRMNSNFTVMKA